jgi:hypothetical protein
MTDPACFWDTRDRASEIKFLVDLVTAARIREWARRMLAPDPHGSGPHGDEYLNISLYFDTHDFAVFRRRGSYGRSKYRIRRYSANNAVFLERKLRTHKVLSKRRTPVHGEDLARLAGRAVDRQWAGAWFQERLLARRLSPVSQVSYRRTARVVATSLGTIRLTVDDDLRALPAAGLRFRPGGGDIVTHDQAIVELKFRVTMPAVFKQLVETFAIEPQKISKYRMAATALGLVSAAAGTPATAADERGTALCLPC